MRDLHSAYLSKLLETVSADDRDWFDRHPGETVRWRSAAAGEFPPRVDDYRPDVPPGFEATLEVEVIKLGEGVRARQPYWVIARKGAAA